MNNNEDYRNNGNMQIQINGGSYTMMLVSSKVMFGIYEDFPSSFNFTTIWKTSRREQDGEPGKEQIPRNFLKNRLNCLSSDLDKA